MTSEVIKAETIDFSLQMIERTLASIIYKQLFSGGDGVQPVARKGYLRA